MSKRDGMGASGGKQEGSMMPSRRAAARAMGGSMERAGRNGGSSSPLSSAERTRLIEAERSAQAALQASEAQLTVELADAKRLQQISSQLIHEGHLEALYNQILTATIAVMHSDMGSMQTFEAEKEALRLLAWQSFDPASAAFWEWVRVDSSSTCGVALRIGERVIVPDVESCDFMTGTQDLEFYRLSGVRGVQSTPLIARDGRLVGMISTHWRAPHQPAERELQVLDVLARQAADLIERRQAEEASAYLAAIVTSAEDAIASKTLDGIVTSWNASAERVFGYSAQEMIGQPILRLFPLDRLDEEDLILARIRAGERIEHFETVRVAKDGRQLAVSLTISPIKDSAGAIIGASKIVRDITERKQVEETLRASELALQEANRRKDDFLGVASHELRTPLTSAKANLQFASRRLARALEAPAPDAASLLAQLLPLQQVLGRCEGALDRLGRLVADLLDISRIEGGKLEMRPRRIDLGKVVRDAVEEEAQTWPGRKILLAGLLDAESDAVWAQADPDRINQIVINYLSNALKYAPAGRPITVRLDWMASREGIGRAARVSVRDEGPGLTLEQQTHLFERFYRVEGITHQQGSVLGLGLGLYICREIAARHGGEVGVESAPGKGTTFWFTLPETAVNGGDAD